MTTVSEPGRKLRLGFLGLNEQARQRMEFILNIDAADVVAVSDDNGDAVAEALSMAPSAESCPNWDKMLGMDLDGMVISTPTIWVVDQIEKTLKSGVPVFCQRPLGRNLEEATRLIEVSSTSDRLLAVDLSYRHLQGIQRIRELVLSGDLGRIYGVEMRNHIAISPDEPWRHDMRSAGGGCVVDLGIHLIDAMLWMTGASVSEVNSHTLIQGKHRLPSDREVEDYASVTLALDSGAVGYLSCAWNLHVGALSRFEMAFYGTHGAAKLRNLNGSLDEFEAEHCVAMQNRIISSPPDDWTGKCLLAWIDKICEKPNYDPAIEEYIHVASVVESIYTQPMGAVVDEHLPEG